MVVSYKDILMLLDVDKTYTSIVLLRVVNTWKLSSCGD